MTKHDNSAGLPAGAPAPDLLHVTTERNMQQEADSAGCASAALRGRARSSARARRGNGGASQVGGMPERDTDYAPDACKT